MRPKDRDADKQEKKRELERGGRRRRDRLEGVERVIESIRVAGRPVGANRPISRRPFRAVKSISRSQWNGSYGADSGPSRSDRCRRALRPSKTFSQTSRSTVVHRPQIVRTANILLKRPSE